MVFFLSVYLLVLSAGYVLEGLNNRHLRRHAGHVPSEFSGLIDTHDLERAESYTLAKNRLGLVESICGNIVAVLFIFGGLLGLYDRWVGGLSDSFVLGGVLFFLLLALLRSALDVPFSLYRNFVLEARYGFNTMTLRLWLADLLKGAVISMLLLGVLLGGALWLIKASPAWWWLWVWGFLALFSLFVMYISPYLIEPLFFKFEPVRKEGLEKEIRTLMEQAGLGVSRVFQVDASRRSRHSNAYFTGIGRVKRIVLFDTLLEQMERDEILSVLAHEVGHWKKKHLFKMLLVTQSLTLAGLFAAHRLVGWEGLPALVGLEQASFYARAVILFVLFGIVAFPLTPLFSAMSRRFEWQADGFARVLHGQPQALATALAKLARENLSNLHPHPLYAAIYYSHPPVVERVRRLLQVRAEG